MSELREVAELIRAREARERYHYAVARFVLWRDELFRSGQLRVVNIGRMIAGRTS